MTVAGDGGPAAARAACSLPGFLNSPGSKMGQRVGYNLARLSAATGSWRSAWKVCDRMGTPWCGGLRSRGVGKPLSREGCSGNLLYLLTNAMSAEAICATNQPGRPRDASATEVPWFVCSSLTRHGVQYDERFIWD